MRSTSCCLRKTTTPVDGTRSTGKAAATPPPLSLLSRRPASTRCASASLTSCSSRSIVTPSATPGAFLGREWEGGREIGLRECSVIVGSLFLRRLFSHHRHPQLRPRPQTTTGLSRPLRRLPAPSVPPPAPLLSPPSAFFGVGAPEAILVGVVALLVFGPKGLAEAVKAVGATLRAFQPTIRELASVSSDSGARSRSRSGWTTSRQS